MAGGRGRGVAPPGPLAGPLAGPALAPAGPGGEARGMDGGDRAGRGAGAAARPLAERVALVVPTLDEAAGIEACLDSLLAGLDPGVPVLVLDGGSTDGTRGIVGRYARRHPDVRLLPNPRRRQAAAVNDAARALGGRDALVRCDAHALYPRGFAAGVLAAMDARGADGLAVPLDAEARAGAGAFARANAMAVDTPLGSGGSAHRGGTRSGWVDHGHHAGLRLAPFVALGGYDEGLVANEDAEYDTRLGRAGGRVWLEASLRVRYLVREAPGALWRQYHAYGRGRAAHLRRRGVRPRARQIAPALHVLALGACLLGAPWLPALLAYPAAYGAVLACASAWLAASRRDAAGLIAWAPLGIMHLAWGTGFWRGLAAR